MAVDYLNPLNRLKWRDAVKTKAPQVTLIDGAKFKLTYLKGGHKGAVFFEPVPTSTSVALVPRGTFDIEKILDDDWLDETYGN